MPFRRHVSPDDQEVQGDADLLARVRALELALSDTNTVLTQGHWDSSWGMVAVGSLPGNAFLSVSAATETVITNTITFTPLTGRRYRAVYRIRAVFPNTTAGPGSMQFRVDGVTLTSTYGTNHQYLVQQFVQNLGAFAFVGDGASHTYNVTFTSTNASGIYLDHGEWYIYDDGPVTPGSTPAAVVNGPRGVVARMTNVTASSYTTASATETDLTATTGGPMSLTFSYDPTRLYRALATVRIQSTVAGDIGQIRFNDVTGTLVQHKAALVVSSATTATVTIVNEWLIVPGDLTAGTATIKITAARGAGTGTISFIASATSPWQFYIEDIGPA